MIDFNGQSQVDISINNIDIKFVLIVFDWRQHAYNNSLSASVKDTCGGLFVCLIA